MGLNMRMWLLVALMFGILYGVITGIGAWMGAGNALFYLVLAFFFIGIQYVIGPSLVQLMMRVRWVTKRDEPELHQMIGELAHMVAIPKPRMGISELAIPNAFAFGKSLRARVSYHGGLCEPKSTYHVATTNIKRVLCTTALQKKIGKWRYLA